MTTSTPTTVKEDTLSKRGPLMFLLHFYKAQWKLLLLSAPTIILAALSQLIIPFIVQTMTSLDEPKINIVQDAILALIEYAVQPVVEPYLMVYFPDLDIRLGCCTIALLSCLLFFGFISYCGKLLIVMAATSCRAAVIEQVVVDVLSSPSPERVAAFESEQFSSLISSSADSVFSVLVVSMMEMFYTSAFALGLVAAILFVFREILISTIKVIIPVLILIGLQTTISGKSRDLGKKAHLLESGAKAEQHNMIQHAEMVNNSQCLDFLSKRFEDKLADCEKANNNFDTFIHSAAGITGGLLNTIKVWLATLLCVYQQNGWLSGGEVNLYLMLVSWAFSCLKDILHVKDHLQNQLAALVIMQRVREWVLHPELDVPLQTTGGEVYQVIHHTSDTADVSLQNVTFRYPQPPEELSQFRRMETPATATLTWKARAHRITALYGPSGCGKSSSLRLLCGLLKPTSGVIHTHKNTRMMEQTHSMMFGSVAENILLQRVGNDSRTAKAAEKALFSRQQEILAESMEKAGCTEFIKDPFHTFINNADHPPFSGGQQQRICLARVFADGDRCSLVLFDEPTTGLDNVSSELVLTSIKELRDRHHKTVIVATHDPRVAEIADDVIQL